MTANDGLMKQCDDVILKFWNEGMMAENGWRMPLMAVNGWIWL